MRRGNFEASQRTFARPAHGASQDIRELELPLGDPTVGELAQSRLRHLAGVGGVDANGLLRLTRAYGSLGEIYAASESELVRIVGAVAAARIRWFLDAPLAMSAVGVARVR